MTNADKRELIRLLTEFTRDSRIVVQDALLIDRTTGETLGELAYTGFGLFDRHYEIREVR